MDKQDFMEFVSMVFEVAPEFMRMLDNVLSYAKNISDENEQYIFLESILSGTIGLTQSEIRDISL